jgi:hypothetical protein
MVLRERADVRPPRGRPDLKNLTEDHMARSESSKTSSNQPAATPSQRVIPAFGKTDKELPDCLRPEVVDIEVVKRLGESDISATSDGTGISGNVRPGARSKKSKPKQG